jgi:eukaryotic-like serine/threonine-protein kinase
MLLERGGLVLLTTILAAQGAAVPASSGLSLLELAKEYRTGDREKAVTEFGRGSREEVEQEVERLVPLFRRASPTATALRPAAVTLLAESALRAGEARAFSRVRWLLLDAARLVAAESGARRGSTFDRRFYLFAGLALHRSGQADAAHGVLLKALENVKDDAELHTALGAVIETIASLRTYDHSPDSRPEGRGGYKTEAGERGSLPFVNLAYSEAHYEKALAIDPTLVEARLRLGRTRLLRGRPAEALRDLEWVAAEASQPRHRYMARLFEGRALEARGDLAGAAAAYRAAVEAVPMAQSALIALGRALDSLGDSATAQEALEAAAARSKPHDPWPGYRQGQPERLPGLLEDLRRLIP